MGLDEVVSMVVRGDNTSNLKTWVEDAKSLKRGDREGGWGKGKKTHLRPKSRTREVVHRTSFLWPSGGQRACHVRI